MTETHSKYSPSSAHRWLECSGCLTLRAPEEVDSPAASEGTKAHEIGARLLEKKPFLEFVPPEMLDAVKMYTAFVQSQKGELFIEKKVRLDGFDDVYGTADALIVEQFLRLTVVDFKYGEGVVVDPYKNPQLILYALGAIDTLFLDVEQIQLCIVQPRAVTGDKIKIWTTTPEEIEPWRQKIKRVHVKVSIGLADFKTGDHCQWCPVSTECPEVQSAVTEAFEKDLSLEKMVKILDAENAIKDCVAKLKAQARDIILKGGSVPGYKLVRSYGYRDWSDTSKLQRKFGLKNITQTKFLSPSAAEKKFPDQKKWIAKHTTRPDRGLVLVPESDRRPAESPVLVFPEDKNV